MIVWRAHLQVRPVSGAAASSSGVSVGPNWALITIAISGLRFAIGGAYFQHGAGCRAPNTERFLGSVQALRAARAKAFVGFGDWDVEPSQLDMAWLRYVGLSIRTHGLEVDGAST